VGSYFFAPLDLLQIFYRRVYRDTSENRPSKPKKPELFADDRVAEKYVVFDEDLIDRRQFPMIPTTAEDSRKPAKDRPNFQINSSAALIALDVEDFDTSDPFQADKLYASYGEAARALESEGMTLASINALDAKAKQFDDGLMAAVSIDLVLGREHPSVEFLFHKLLTKLERDEEAYAWVWAGLSAVDRLTPEESRASPPGATDHEKRFEALREYSEPSAFYVWNDDLKATYRLMRYGQQPLRVAPVPGRDPDPPPAIALRLAEVIAGDADLSLHYEDLLSVFASLSNKSKTWTLNKIDEWHAQACLLPSSTSREVELFFELYDELPGGIPDGTDLMYEFVRAIRDGTVELSPAPDSGWFDYQVHALETFLLPERGREHEKLVLNKKYKERMLQAFQAILVKRIETHYLSRGIQSQVAMSTQKLTSMSGSFSVPLRVEPNPTYFLRMARSYAFLQAHLTATVPKERLDRLHGLWEGGARRVGLAEELEWMRRLYYGLYLISCEDIGLDPDAKDASRVDGKLSFPKDTAAKGLLDGELGEESGERLACYELAETWLKTWESDPDLSVDVRVLAPIVFDYPNRRTTFWSVPGVRLVKLRVTYAEGPRWRPVAPTGEQPEPWQDFEAHRLRPLVYYVMADEFASFERDGMDPISREDFRAACERGGTKDDIVERLMR